MKITHDKAELLMLQVCQEWQKGTQFQRFAINISDASNDDELHCVISFLHKYRKEPFNYYGIVDLNDRTVILFREMITKQF